MFKAALCAPDLAYHLVAVFRFTAERLVNPLLQVQIHIRRPNIVQIFGNAAHIFGDGHVVIIQHNNEIRLQAGSVIQRLIRHAARKRPVADHRDDGVISALNISRFHHAEPCRYGGGTVPCVKTVAVALLPLRETAHTAEFPQVHKTVPPSRQNLMGIGLVSHIPNQFVLRQV